MNPYDISAERKMIITDMDGTIMPSPTLLPKETSDVLRRAYEKNVLVVLASARPLGMMRHIHDGICPDMPFVSLNGARIYTPDGETVAVHDVDVDTVSSIFDGLGKKDKLSNVVIEHGNNLYTVKMPKNKYMIEEMRCVGREPLDKSSLPKIPVSRLMLYTEDEEYNKFLCELCHKIAEPKYSVRLRVFEKNGKPSTYRYEISNPEADKWKAAQLLMKMYKIDPENVWAFGDEWNDRDMVSHAAHGYAIKGSTVDGCGVGSTDNVTKVIEDEVLS